MSKLDSIPLALMLTVALGGFGLAAWGLAITTAETRKLQGAPWRIESSRGVETGYHFGSYQGTTSWDDEHGNRVETTEVVRAVRMATSEAKP